MRDDGMPGPARGFSSPAKPEPPRTQLQPPRQRGSRWRARYIRRVPRAASAAPPAAIRLAQGLACGGFAQLVQMPYLRESGELVSLAFFSAHGLVVLAVHLALALGLGRWPPLWTATAFAIAPALAVWPTVHLDFGASGLAILGLGVVSGVAALAWLAPSASPLVAAAAGGLLGAELARWSGMGSDPSDALRPLVAGGIATGLWVAARGRPRLAPLPGATASLALCGAALALAAVVAPVASDPLPVGPAGPVASEAPAPAVLIVLDTVRADHLAMYGYERDTMPAFERFAREQAVVVERAVAVSSTSLPSHASMFTGLSPPRHGARYADAADPRPPRYAYPLGPHPPTLAEKLGEVGYWSVGISGNAGPLSPEYGLARGFDVYRASFDPTAALRQRTAWHLASPRAEPLIGLSGLPVFRDVELFAWGQRYRRARSIASEAIAAIDAAGDHPFFLFVNFIDAHWPYDPPARCRDSFRGSMQSLGRLDLPAPARVNLEGRVLRPREREQLAALYDGELRCMDDALDRLLRRLERHPRFDEMLVVITSDHGEALGEHGTLGHGVSLYDEQLRVPLVLKPGRGPRLPQPGSRLPGPIVSTDLFPTVLEHAGLAPPLDGDGRAWGRGRRIARSWLGVKRRYAVVRPDRFRRDLRTVEEAGWKLVVSSQDRVELYDLARDPAEGDDLSASEAGRLGGLLHQLGSAPSASPGPRARPGEKTLERLRLLGYLE